MLKIKDLLPDEANFNTGTEFGNSLIDKSLSKFGAGRSILIDKNNRIIAGNKTIENAAANGFDDIVIVETTGEQIVAVKRTDIDLNTKKGREMALADNATAKANISWDAQTLTEWEMPLAEWGIDLTDITEVEPAGEADAEPQIDKAAELNKKWGVVSGDLWQIGSHRLLCGDSTKRDDVELLMGGEKALLMVSDPPYNVKYEYDSIDDNQDDAAYAAFCDAYFALGASISQMQIITPGKANERLYAYKEYMTWFKGFGLSRGSFYKAMVTEPILLFGEKPTNKFYNTDHFHFGTDREAGLREMHSCPKPKDLFNALIEPMSDKGDLVYEAFGGSGTTLVACQNLNRKCYAIEISENYCAVILERMATAFPDIEIKRLENAIRVLEDHKTQM